MHKYLRRQLCLLAGTVILATTGMSSVAAQDARVLEEIVVTAAYREQGLQDVPVSISAVTGDVMAETAIQKAEDIQFLVPNFTLTETGIGTNAFIRGIGSGINQAFEQSVGTYVDGVHYGRAQQWRSPFLDIERVEVLRGPQSILFGKNSVAGAMNITTAKPTSELEGSFLVSNEFEHDELIVEGIVSGPLGERMRGRLAARVRDGDGHMQNLTLDRPEPKREDTVVRGTLEFDITDNVMATFKAEFGEFDVTGRHIEIINEQAAGGGPFAGLPYHRILGIFGADSTVTNVTQDEKRSSNGDFSNNESTTYALTLDWAIGEHELKSITAWSEFDYDELCDCDFTGAVVFDAALQESYEQLSQEIRLSSPLGDDYDYILGVYYQWSDHDFFDQINIAPDSVLVPVVNASSPGAGSLLANTRAFRRAIVDATVLSAFAQFNWHISDVFTLQLGGRITQDERDGFRSLEIQALDGSPLPAPQAIAPLVYANPAIFGISSTNLANLGPTGAGLIALLGELPVSGNRDQSKFSPEVKLIWDINDDVLAYFTWAEGFKSGSFDFRANNRSFFPTMEDSFEFDDEEASSFELGGKFTLGDGAAEINAALFSTDFDNLQISIFDGILGFNVGNAASAEVQGLEVDLRWAATDRMTITGGIAFTDFEFTDFENGQCYFGQAPDSDIDGDMIPDACSYTGNSNQMVSDIQGNIAVDYRMPIGDNLEMSWLFDFFHTTDYDASATFDPALEQGKYGIINLRLGIGDLDGDWQIALLGKNLTDEKVLSFGGDTPLAGSSFGAKSNYAFYGPGQTITLQGLFRF
ncbi:MAG: TonB-dependent receptor [Gammaproteobacteria bacterium]|nr:TonB-dependent receptor [Gammaproteobacteria bacterium]